MVRRMFDPIRDASEAVRAATRELQRTKAVEQPPVLGLDDLGAVAVVLALRWPAWVDRREIEICFVDDATVRITTAVSFHLTAEAVGGELQVGTPVYVPLDMPEKQTLLNSRITDEDGRVLAPLNQARNGDLAGRGLARLFSQLLEDAGFKLPGRTELALHGLAQSQLTEAKRYQDVSTDPTGILGRWLNEDPERVRPEMQIISGLTYGFLQLVQIEYQPGRERRIQTVHDVPLPWPKKQDHRWLVSLGGLSQQRTFDPVSIGRARSTHVEFVAPDDMDLVSARLQGYQYDTVAHARDELRVVARSFERSRERARLHTTLLAGAELLDPGTRSVADALTSIPAIDLVQLQSEGASDQAAATVSLLPRRSGTIPAAGLASTATAVTLVIFASRLKELDGQTGAAVLLLLPAILTAYLSRPGEHRFTTRALRTTRMLAALSAMCAVVLSAMIAGGFLSASSHRRAGRISTYIPTAANHIAWALAVISSVIALVLLFAWGLATLMARQVPSDDQLASMARIPSQPRSWESSDD